MVKKFTIIFIGTPRLQSQVYHVSRNWSSPIKIPIHETVIRHSMLFTIQQRWKKDRGSLKLGEAIVSLEIERITVYFAAQQLKLAKRPINYDETESTLATDHD